MQPLKGEDRGQIQEQMGKHCQEECEPTARNQKLETKDRQDWRNEACWSDQSSIWFVAPYWIG